jgi:hypothetical protein
LSGTLIRRHALRFSRTALLQKRGVSQIVAAAKPKPAITSMK